MYKDFERIISEKGFKVSDVAKGTGIRQGVFSDWKAGRYTPKADKMQKVADFLGVPVSELYGKTTEIHHYEVLERQAPSDPGKKLTKVEYYMDSETAQVAQDILDNHNLRLLFDAARTASEEDIRTTYAMLMALKRKEEHEDDLP